MAKNKIENLRDHLFEALERLNDDELMCTPEIREKEIARAKAMADVGQVILNSAKLEIDYMKQVDKQGKNPMVTPFIQLNDK